MSQNRKKPEGISKGGDAGLISTGTEKLIITFNTMPHTTEFSGGISIENVTNEEIALIMKYRVFAVFEHFSIIL
ncbi:hypothetical protein Bccel_3579 [Pseudobacteroides cellulosolvens ATCC 35603 = DSM 2933]|uniref:Uncharacterized protein n=1 Tax=Pseudobacteroides cellulosolvens ATCC 35603 = DSM 2933 TaxID=398512 RepID=A0A0L6JRJ3_9FIRM|nr:hypothetical protein [Pseudobacteroides cellulosolvens]KNY28305.1 hypothetical protein Bccel_3579 [Pseudobacteroides cellulosolvens ATCC 35603 = DSM 2933]